MPAPPLTARRPTVQIAGREVPDLAADLLELTIHEQVGEAARLTALFVNNHGGAPRYPDDQHLALGHEIAISLGDELFFTGRLLKLEGRFLHDRPPVIAVVAEARPAPAAAARATLGHELREVAVALDNARARGARGGARLIARGLIDGWSLRTGGRLTLQGLGPVFSGEFKVDDVTRRFNQEHGLHADFIASGADAP